MVLLLLEALRHSQSIGKYYLRDIAKADSIIRQRSYIVYSIIRRHFSFINQSSSTGSLLNMLANYELVRVDWYT